MIKVKFIRTITHKYLKVLKDTKNRYFGVELENTFKEQINIKLFYNIYLRKRNNNYALAVIIFKNLPTIF